MRQTRGSMICPHCGKLISVSEDKCPFCGAWRPGLYGYAPAMQRWFGRGLDFPRLVTTACIVLYVVALALQPDAIFRSIGFFSFLSPGSRALYQLGMTGGIAWASGWWWTIFTAIYLHGGLLHILFNMLWVRDLGPAVADVFGTARAFVIFTVAGAVGFLVSNVATSMGHGMASQTIGASGSIFGLLAALIVYHRRGGSSAMTGHLLQWAGLMFLMGFFMPSVNNWAHAGGFAAGWVSAEAMAAGGEQREGRIVMVLAIALLAVTVVGFVLSFVNVTAALMGR